MCTIPVALFSFSQKYFTLQRLKMFFCRHVLSVLNLISVVHVVALFRHNVICAHQSTWLKFGHKCTTLALLNAVKKAFHKQMRTALKTMRQPRRELTQFIFDAFSPVILPSTGLVGVG